MVYFDVCTAHLVQFIIQSNKCKTYIYVCVCVCFVYLLVWIINDMIYFESTVLNMKYIKRQKNILWFYG